LVLTGCYASNRSWPVGNDVTGEQMQPGLWRSLGNDPASAGPGWCAWEKHDAQGNLTGHSVVFGSMYPAGHKGPVVALIGRDDKDFNSRGCLPFYRIYPPVIPEWSVPLVQPGQPFGDGDYLTGSEITPGFYMATAPGGFDTQCWAGVIKNWYGALGWSDPGRNIDSVNTTSSRVVFATILPTDAGFSSMGCGQWIRLPF
jgi:hypothetical protein